MAAEILALLDLLRLTALFLPVFPSPRRGRVEGTRWRVAEGAGTGRQIRRLGFSGPTTGTTRTSSQAARWRRLRVPRMEPQLADLATGDSS
ncbi:hypothetical protein E2562_030849 [Oryza meyeriana var. granulata]|uniref:DUF834 domain-containing protein n=1 Tax=Oryza meyeriana var. granulata TaxID=110450 RepID=A0A6G1F054_9ORYZ|nr:hypothetical protein E2562_030849 [Oryza meyeriana var. granulata]